MLNQFDLNHYPHKFFYRDLDLDLNDVTTKLKFEYNRIKNAEMRGVKPIAFDTPNREIFLEPRYKIIDPNSKQITGIQIETNQVIPVVPQENTTTSNQTDLPILERSNEIDIFFFGGPGE